MWFDQREFTVFVAKQTATKLSIIFGALTVIYLLIDFGFDIGRMSCAP